MFFQAFFLLRKLKKAQQELSKEVFIDYSNNVALTVHNGKETFTCVKLGKLGAPKLILEYLQEEKYIRIPHKEYVQVTSRGWYFFQILLNKLCIFLFRSILVPIITAVITTIITTFITTHLC